jgi:hypothetical protein
MGQLEWTKLSALGTYVVDFTGAKEGTNKCKTKGDLAEALLTKGEVHLVFGALSIPELVVGALFLVPKPKSYVGQ